MVTIKDICSELKQKDKFLVISHASPDGDTLGSATALIRALRDMGKKADFSCDDVIDDKYAYLFEGLDNIGFAPEYYVSVDVASPQLLGKNSEYEMDMVIDHHAINSLQGKIKFVDSTAATNTLIIFEIIKELGVKVCNKIADSLFTGLTTDTGCFKYSNTDPRTHRAAADLIEAGANAYSINKVMFDNKTKSGLKAEQYVFSNLEFHLDDKVVIAYMPQSLFTETGATEADLEGIPSMVRGIEGVRLAVTLKEKDTGLWKASVRGVAPYNAGKLCENLGGGGHPGAGGCALTTSLEESRARLLVECKKAIESVEEG